MTVLTGAGSSWRRLLLEKLLDALEWLALHPPCGLDPVHAHDYWLPNEVALLGGVRSASRPLDISRFVGAEVRSVDVEAAGSNTELDSNTPGSLLLLKRTDN